MATEICAECHVQIAPGDLHPPPYSVAHGQLNQRRKAAALQERRKVVAARKPAPAKRGRFVADAWLEVSERAADLPDEAADERRRVQAGRAKATAELERRSDYDKRDCSVDFIWSPPNRPSR